MRGEKEGDEDESDEEPAAESGEEFAQGRDLSALVDLDLGGRLAGSGDGFVDARGEVAKVGAGVIRGEGREALHIVSIILRDGDAFLERRDGTEQHGLLAGVADGQVAEILDALGRGARNLHLDLEGDAGLGVGPVVGQDEAAGTGGFDHGAGGVVELDAHEAGFLTVDVHFERGRVERLGELDVAQLGNLGEFGADGFGVCAVIREGRSADGDLDRGRRAEAHDAAHDVGRLERKADVRQGDAEIATKVLLGGVEVDLGAGLELDLEGGLIGAAVPRVDEVDGVVGGVDADESERGADVIGAEFRLDEAEGLQGDLLGLVELSTGRRTQAYLELAVVGAREDLAAKLGAEQGDERDPAEESGHDEGLLTGEHAVEQRGIARLKAVEKADLMGAAVLQEPDREDR